MKEGPIMDCLPIPQFLPQFLAKGVSKTYLKQRPPIAFPLSSKPKDAFYTHTRTCICTRCKLHSSTTYSNTKCLGPNVTLHSTQYCYFKCWPISLFESNITCIAHGPFFTRLWCVYMYMYINMCCPKWVLAFTFLLVKDCCNYQTYH